MPKISEQSGAARPCRLLLLEDEELVECLVHFALQDTGIQLVHCRSVAEAERAMAARPFDILLADLHLPGESGLSFLGRLPGVPGWRPSMHTIAFSSGLTAIVRSELESAGVHTMLEKPASVAALRACLSEAAGWVSAQEAHARAPAVSRNRMDRAHCLQSLDSDLPLLQEAMEQSDLTSTARLMRDWMPILDAIGDADAVSDAHSLELAAMSGDSFAAQSAWTALHLRILGMATVPAGIGESA